MPLLSTLRTALLVLSALSLACGTPTAQPRDPPAPSSGTQALVERAADLEGVPRPLLVAIGWIDSRLSMNGGVPSADHAYGLFHLIDEEAAPAAGESGEEAPAAAPGTPSAARRALSLQRAARLTGLSPAALKTDPLANARGGAALLRAEQERLLATYPDLREERLGDWFQAVMRLSGADGAAIADAYASQVYRLLQGGLSAETDGGPARIVPQEFALEGRAIWGELSQDLSGQYCPGGACVAFVPASTSNYSVGRGVPITTIVIHDMEGYYSTSITWFQNPQAAACAHYLIRSSDGQITQMVKDEDTAWHAGNTAVNHAAIGIEHEGFAAQGATWYTETMYKSSAALVRWITDTYQIPRDRTHIIGHYEVPDASHTTGGTDPAHPGWYGGAHAHHDPCDTWLGDPTWHNTKACYWDWAHYLDLVNGATGGNGGNGTLTGFVGDACCGTAAGTRKPLVGALVTLTGTGLSASTGTDGSYSLSVAPGSYSPVASFAGYAPGDHSSLGSGYPATLSVTAKQTTWGSILLTPHLTTPPAQKPVVTIAQPVDGRAAAATPVTVAGTIDDRAVTTVTIAGRPFPAVGGAFTGTADLVSGQNTIAVTASNAAGSGSATVHVSYAPPSSGIAGTVHGTGGTALEAVAIALQPGAHKVVSDVRGGFSLALDPGDYTLNTDAAGYQVLSRPVSVVAGNVVTLDLQLLADPAPPAPRVRIDQPAESQSFTAPAVTVSGLVVVHDLVSVTVAGEQVSVDAAGSFSFQVTLAKGNNRLTVVATDKSGRQTAATVDVDYAPLAIVAAGGCQGAPVTAWALLGLLALVLRPRAAGRGAAAARLR